MKRLLRQLSSAARIRNAQRLRASAVANAQKANAARLKVSAARQRVNAARQKASAAKQKVNAARLKVSAQRHAQTARLQQAKMLLSNLQNPAVFPHDIKDIVFRDNIFFLYIFVDR